MASSERFGYEWDTYADMTAQYEGQFKNWISPLSEHFFKGKSLLDVGCGMGRNSYWPLVWGVSKVTAFDLDPRTVERAKKTLEKFPNVEVLQKSAYEMNWKEQFDIAMSIGVIHHLEHPEKVLQSMVEALKPGGTLLVWVYSYEGYEWVRDYVTPFRKSVTSRLPVGLVHVLSYFFSIPLWIIVKIFRGPSEYFKQLSKFSLWHIHSIVFDQLIPTVANYWTKDEVTKMIGSLGLKEFKVNRPPNNNGWTIVGTK